MKELNHTVRLAAPVDDGLHRVATDLLQHTQDAFARISSEQAKLQARIEELTRENHQLRHDNLKLREDMQSMVQPNGPGPGGRQGAGADAAEPFAFIRNIAIHSAPVHSVAIDNKKEGNKRIATASWDATVKLYDLTSNEVCRTLGGSEAPENSRMGGLYAVAYAKTAPDILGCTSCDHSVYIWNHATGQLAQKLSAHKDEVNGIDFHSSQQVMCSASDDCKVIIWDFQEGMVLRTLDKHTKSVYGCRFLGVEHEYYVASCCFDRVSRVWDMRDKQIVATLEMHTDDVIGIDYSSQKRLVATGSDDGKIGIWDTRNWSLRQEINTRMDHYLAENEVKRVSFSPDGSLLAAACSSGAVLVYDFENSNEPMAQLGGHSDCVFDVSWGVCPQTGMRMLVSASHDHSCRYWREMK